GVLLRLLQHLGVDLGGCDGHRSPLSSSVFSPRGWPPCVRALPLPDGLSSVLSVRSLSEPPRPDADRAARWSVRVASGCVNCPVGTGRRRGGRRSTPAPSGRWSPVGRPSPPKLPKPARRRCG